MERPSTKLINYLQLLKSKYWQYIPEDQHEQFEHDVFKVWSILQLELYYFDELYKKLKEKSVA